MKPQHVRLNFFHRRRCASNLRTAVFGNISSDLVDLFFGDSDVTNPLILVQKRDDETVHIHWLPIY